MRVGRSPGLSRLTLATRSGPAKVGRITTCGVTRVRISTTVEDDLLAQRRLVLGQSDNKVIDRALAALINEIETEREVAALTAHPYEDDPDLAWQPPAGPDLDYEGEVPAEVLRLAARRRRH